MKYATITSMIVAALLLVAPAMAAPGHGPKAAPAPTPTSCGDRAEFQALFVQRLRKAQPDHEVVEVALFDLIVRKDGEEKVRIFLDNKYGDCIDRPQDRDFIIDGFVAATSQMLTSAKDEATVDERRERAFSLLRPSALARDPALKGGSLIHRPFAGDMMEVVAEQLPGAVRYVVAEDSEVFGASRDAVWKLARGNVAKRITGITARPVSPGVYIVEAESFDAPSLLLEPGFWRERITAATGQPIVFLADREYFYYADSANPRAVEALREFVRNDNGNAMSLKLYRRQADGSWTAID